MQVLTDISHGLAHWVLCLTLGFLAYTLDRCVAHMRKHKVSHELCLIMHIATLVVAFLDSIWLIALSIKNLTAAFPNEIMFVLAQMSNLL